MSEVSTAEQRAQYRDEGYTVIRALIPRGPLAALRARLMELRDGRHDWPPEHFQVLDPARFRNPDGSLIPVGVQVPSQRDPVFAAVADHERLRAAMSELLGGPATRFTDQALIKSPEAGSPSFYHQDSYYWRIEPQLGCNAWIALDTVGADASALAIVPASHRGWQLIEHEAYFDEPSFHSAVDGRAFKRWRIPPEHLDTAREVMLPMQPGDAAFFTNYTWHRAEPNFSGETKCAYAIAYQRTVE